MIKIRNRVIPAWVFAYVAILIVVVLVLAVVSESETVYTIRITYTIQPVTQLEEAPTQNSTLDTLALGTVVSGSTGVKQFGEITTLYLPSSRVNLELDKASADDFEKFSVYVIALGAVSMSVGKGGTKTYGILPTADYYGISVYVTYTAKNVTTTTSGEVMATLSWPLVVKFPGE